MTTYFDVYGVLLIKESFYVMLILMMMIKGVLVAPVHFFAKRARYHAPHTYPTYHQKNLRFSKNQ